MKRIISFFLTLLSINSYSQGLEFQNLYTKLQLFKDATPLIKSGIKATMQFGKMLEDLKSKELADDYVNIQSASFLIGTKEFQVEYAFKPAFEDSELSKSRPTLIAQFGFGGGLRQGNALFFLTHSEEVAKGFNLLLIQSSSSASFGLANCHATLGGLLDTLLITKLIDKARKDYGPEYFNRFLLLGGSSSTAGLFHASLILNDLYPLNFRGLFIQAGYESMKEPFDAIEFIGGEKKGNKPKLLHRYAARKMTDSRLKALKEHPRCQQSFEKAKTFRDLLAISFDAVSKGIEQEMEAMPRSELYAQVDYAGLRGYIESLSLTPFYLTSGGFPFVIVHSENDPLSPYAYIKRLIDSRAREFPAFLPLVVPYGGHAGFRESYGVRWHVELIKTFLGLAEDEFQ